jgi:hypothetical protein
MGRRQERLRAKRDGIKLDERCAYCGNDQPGTLKHVAILASGMVRAVTAMRVSSVAKRASSTMPVACASVPE